MFFSRSKANVGIELPKGIDNYKEEERLALLNLDIKIELPPADKPNIVEKAMDVIGKANSTYIGTQLGGKNWQGHCKEN